MLPADPLPSPSGRFDEDRLLPISALQHLLFCERQCALIHIEGLWVENRLTAEGRQLHERAHDAPDETRAGVRIARGLDLRSLHLGLIGKSDVVEFRLTDGKRVPFPVEYKRGRPKAHDADRVQLCAQALCLEEMLGVDVPCGALYYGATRRRLDVPFDAALRELTATTAQRLHTLIGGGRTPRAMREPRCDQCSLIGVCLPDSTGEEQSATTYLANAMADAIADDAGGGR